MLFLSQNGVHIEIIFNTLNPDNITERASNATNDFEFLGNDVFME